jgi:hypothetical protein
MLKQTDDAKRKLLGAIPQRLLPAKIQFHKIVTPA